MVNLLFIGLFLDNSSLFYGATGCFNSKAKCWLVLWELGLVLELPANTVVFFPSALFHHWNVSATGN
jgi:hypothetical protein